MAKTSKSYRIDDNLIEKLENTVERLNKYVGYEEYTLTNLIEKLISKYLPYLEQQEIEAYDSTLGGALKKMME